MLDGLKGVRSRTGKTQKQIAELLSVPYATYRNWEQQKAFPRAGELQALTTFFGCNVDELMSGNPGSEGMPKKSRDVSTIDDANSSCDIWTLVAIYHLITDEGKRILTDCAMGLIHDTSYSSLAASVRDK